MFEDEINKTAGALFRMLPSTLLRQNNPSVIIESALNLPSHSDLEDEA
jgi:hypothetical protein